MKFIFSKKRGFKIYFKHLSLKYILFTRMQSNTPKRIIYVHNGLVEFEQYL